MPVLVAPASLPARLVARLRSRRHPANQQPRTCLMYDLLSSMFTPAELRRVIAMQLDGSSLLAELSDDVAPAVFMFEAVRAFERHGWLDHELFDALQAARPRRQAEIARVAACVL